MATKEVAFNEVLDFLKKLSDCKINKATKEELFRKIDALTSLFQDLNKENEKLKKKVEDARQVTSTHQVRSYSEVTKLPTSFLKPQTKRFTSIIKLKNSNSGTDCKEEFKKVINPRQMKLGIQTMKKTRNGEVIVSVGTKLEMDTIVNEINGKKCDIKAEELKKLKPLIIVKNIPDELDKDNLLNTLCEQNDLPHEDMKLRTVLSNVNRAGASGEKKRTWRHAVLEVNGSTRRQLLEGGAKLGYQICNVEDYSTVVRCFHCSRLRHPAKFCQAAKEDQPPTCPICAEAHTRREYACSSNEAVHLQQRLRSLSSELVTLRNRLGQQGSPPVPAINSQDTADPERSGGEAMPPWGADIEDLIHLPGPLTEDAVLKALHARFIHNHTYTTVGPILVSVNGYNDVGNPLTLSSTRGVPLSPKLLRVVQEAVRHQSETGYPQAIILSGSSGSGKTYASMLLLRQLFEVAGGGPETDAFKHLAAAFTVLRSLGSAKTTSNSESSRIGHFIEVQVTDGALYRTKIHCYFLDQTRVIKPLKNEKNYHIFYQMLAGLLPEERTKLNLDGYNLHNLAYLKCGDTRQDEAEDAARFQAWKTCLGVLGIPFLDVVRVLAGVMLLGNVVLAESGGCVEVSPGKEAELNSVASLLGVSPQSLLRGITSRTHNSRGNIIKSYCDPNMSNMIRDSLAKALYCRTVATIVRRANSLKRLGSTLGTLSSDSNESVHNQAEVASQHASTIGTAGSKSSKSMAALNNAVRHATDGFIGILDMFGFEDPRPSHLEHLCINLCSETMQHFYNTHIFKSSIESCRDEGIHSDVEVDYVDNVPCIDLISSLRTGLLSMLDVECSIRGSAEGYITKVKAQHRPNGRLFDPKPIEPRMFGIQHFAGRVIYDATDFLDTNRDVVPDDLVAVFHKQNCNFGFATHLFGSELKALYASDTVPRGVSFRISPTSHSDLLNGDEPVSTLTQDFHTRLDNLLRTLVHARPHFIRCVRANSAETPQRFDRAVVMRQIRSLQVLETVNLMAGGFPHRMRFKAFLSRYRVIARAGDLRRGEDKYVEDCHTILSCLDGKPRPPGLVVTWAIGKRHIFLSEGLRQELEAVRWETLHRAAVTIQAAWRGYHGRKRWPTLKRTLQTAPTPHPTLTKGRSAVGPLTRPRPQPIAGTPPPELTDKCDHKIIAQTCTLFGLDLERPPPVPPSRPYTVTGNTKLGYPQTRVMKMPFPDDGSGDVSLLKGDTVTVVGASPRRGHLVVEHSSHSLHIPFQFLELKPSPLTI